MILAIWSFGIYCWRLEPRGSSNASRKEIKRTGCVQGLLVITDNLKAAIECTRDTLSQDR